MPFMIRPREDARVNFMRDGVGFKAPLRWICADWFALFDGLPTDVDEDGTSYLQVIKAEDKAEAEVKAKALGFPLKDETLTDDDIPQHPTSWRKTAEKPVKVSEYLRSEARGERKVEEPLAEQVADSIDASLDGVPSGASFGVASEPEPEPEPEPERKPKNYRRKSKR